MPEETQPAGAFDPETSPQVTDPMQLLGEGMKPLPAGTDMDRLIAAYDLIGRMGMANFEVGYNDEDPEDCCWYARCETGDGQGFLVEGKSRADLAAEALARKLSNGGRCTHCGKVSTLWTAGAEDSAGVGQQNRAWICYWHREGKMWHRGCEATHHDRAATRDAINEYIDRTNSPAPREV